MRRFPLRPVILGILAGTALFIAPIFFVRVGLFILVVGALFRLGRRRRYMMHPHGHPYWQMQQESNVVNLRNRNAQDIAID